MYIEKTVEMNLSELLKWAWHNDIKDETFKSDTGIECFFTDKGSFVIKDCEFIKEDDIFEVEIKEEVDMYTKLDLFYMNDRNDVDHLNDSCINEVLLSERDFGRSVKYIYLKNEDDSIGQLIWKRGLIVD